MSKQSEFYSDLAVSLGLRYDGANNVLYGQRDGFDLMVYPADSRYPYTLSVHTAARSSYGTILVSQDTKELTKSVKAMSSCKQEGNNIIATFFNQAKLEKMKANLSEGINALLAFLKKKGYGPCCSLCGKAVEEIAAFKSGSSYSHLCPDCERTMLGNLATATQMNQKKKENVIGGVVGALLGSLLGVVCIILLSQMGYVAALSGIAMAIGVLKGYELLGGKLTKKGIIIGSVIMLIMTYVGDRLDWAIVLLRDGGGADAGYNLFECYRLVPKMIELEMVEMSTYVGNPLLLYVFLLLGAVPTIISKVREKQEEGKMVKIGSSGSYGSFVQNV